MGKTVLIIFLFISLVGCSSDKDNNEEKFDSSILQGEWYLFDGQVITDLSIQFNTLSATLYQNTSSSPVVCDEWSGFWTFFAESKTINASISHKIRDLEEIKAWGVIQVNEYLLELLDKKLGAQENYYKVVENNTIGIGDSQIIDYFSKHMEIKPTSYTSSNPSIATVANDGIITGVSRGVAFIRISSNVGIMIVKVLVK